MTGIAHLLRATAAIAIGGVALIGIELGAAWMIAQALAPPVDPAVPAGAITGEVIRWLFFVGLLGRVVALGCLGLAMAATAARVGYRTRDGWFALVPVYGIVLAVKFAWRATEPGPRFAPAAREHRLSLA